MSKSKKSKGKKVKNSKKKAVWSWVNYTVQLMQL